MLMDLGGRRSGRLGRVGTRARGRLGEGERVTLDLDALTLRAADGSVLPCEPIPCFLLDMVRAGGLMNQLRERLQRERAASGAAA